MAFRFLIAVGLVAVAMVLLEVGSPDRLSTLVAGFVAADIALQFVRLLAPLQAKPNKSRHISRLVAVFFGIFWCISIHFCFGRLFGYRSAVYNSWLPPFTEARAWCAIVSMYVSLEFQGS